MPRNLISLDDIRSAQKRIAATALITPSIHSTSFSRMTGRDVWFKAENLQRTGSFKIRGAMNVLSQLDEDARAAGVVAASAGNHAQGVALAAQSTGVPATVFMPETAPLPKVQATKEYGAEVRLTGTSLEDAVVAARAFADESGARFIHPYDDVTIMTGQGTLGIEVAEQIPAAASVVIPVGGGGLMGGSAAALKGLRPDLVVAGVEIVTANTYVLSRDRGRPTAVPPRSTVADGIAVHEPSRLAFDHIEAFVDDLVTVDDPQAMQAVALLLERTKLMVEASGAVGLAALLAGKLEDLPDPLVIVLSGGNIDLLLLNRVIRGGLAAAGRFAWYRVRIPDVPGQLAGLLEVIASNGGNVVSIEHYREEGGVPVGFTEVLIAVETRGPEHSAELKEALREHGLVV
ncbi:MAG: threonine ammonia-lyase [Acidimicrobiia bacterium]|nr:threonine ammonia-lyase [Acidimicrobiia bacterium]